MKSIKFYVQSRPIEEEMSIVALKKVVDGVSTESIYNFKTENIKDEILNILVSNLKTVDNNSNIKIYLSSSYLSRANRFRNIDIRNKSCKNFLSFLTNNKYNIKLLPIDGTEYEKDLLDLTC